jgi:hypothetical protein
MNGGSPPSKLVGGVVRAGEACGIAGGSVGKRGVMLSVHSEKTNSEDLTAAPGMPW